MNPLIIVKRWNRYSRTFIAVVRRRNGKWSVCTGENGTRTEAIEMAADFYLSEPKHA